MKTARKGNPVHMVRAPEQAIALLGPDRMRLVKELREPDSASGLARRLQMPRQRVNYHLRELEKHELVELVEERKKGNCTERIVRATARSYLISPEVLGSLGATPEEVQDRFSSSYLIATAARTIYDLAVLRPRAQKAGKRLATLTMQVDVRFASAADRDRFAQELGDAVARLVAKYHNEKARAGRTFRFTLSSHPVITKDEEGRPLTGAAVH